MKRRDFLFAAVAAGLMPRALFAQRPFASSRLSVVVRGSGRDVILIPGLAAARTIWNGTVVALPGYRYHMIQVAGFAGDPARGNASGALVVPLAGEIVRYIAAAGLRAPAIVGHSMGGTIAMLLAARWPARVGRLMVVDMLPAPAGLLGSNAAALRPFADSLRDIFTSSPGGRRLFGQLIGGNAGGANGSDPDVVGRAAHELALLDLTPELPRIKAPMHIVYATPPASDRVDPARIVRDYKAAYARAPAATLVRVQNSGHVIMQDQPAKFHAALKAFMAD